MLQLRTTLEAWSRPAIVSFLVFVFLGFSIVFAWQGSGPGGQVPDGQLVYSPKTLWSFLENLGSSGRRSYTAMEWLADTPFALAYGALGSMLLLLLANRSGSTGWWWVPLVGGGCDVFENALLGAMALFHPHWPLFLAWISCFLTVLKWIALLASLLLILWRWKRRKKHGWMVVGFFWLWVGLLAVSRGDPMVAGGWLLVAAAVIHWKWLYLAQYAFFLRYPILIALGLSFLPQIARPSFLLGNLLVVESVPGLLWVSFMATMVALTVMSVMRLVYLTAPYRNRLTLVRPPEKRPPEILPGFWTRADAFDLAEQMKGDSAKAREAHVKINQLFLGYLAPWLVRARVLVFGLLAVPLLEGVDRASPGLAKPYLFAGWATALGAGVAASGWLEPRLRAAWRLKAARMPRINNPTPAALTDWFAPFGRRLFGGFGRRGHGPVALVAGVATVIYLAISPLVLGVEASREMAHRLPPILYLLFIIAVLAWLSSIVALMLDRSRIPVALVALAILAALFGISQGDRYYELHPKASGWGLLPEATDVVRKRRTPEQGDYVTVVAASGGGIRASLWTARVLQGLHDAVGASLTDSILLVSSTSGGSVGAMYYMDAFDESGLTSARLSCVVEAAGASSLSAAVWGMAYPDLWRVVSGGFYPRGDDRTLDRGWAMDRRWEQERCRVAGREDCDSSAAVPARLGGWVDGVIAGWRPAHVFNATVVETGAAMRIATVRLSDPNETVADPGSQTREFAQLYPHADVDVATAARLSASFPWVSPMARPWMKATGVTHLAGGDEGKRDSLLRDLEASAFHLADGGYFDNFGVYSAIDFLTRAKPALMEERVRRVIFIQIRATTEFSSGPKRGGFKYSTVGPLLAMNAVRTSSQIGRNDNELALLKDAWQRDGITVCPVVFSPGEVVPLSWHLSKKERTRLKSAWDGEPETRARKLRDYLSKPEGPEWSCPKELAW